MAFLSASRTPANWYAAVSSSRPAAAVEGALLVVVAFGYSKSTANVFTPPAGFTVAASHSAAFNASVCVAYRVMGPSEPASYTWTASVGTSGWIAQIVYDTTTTVEDAAGAWYAAGTATATAPSVNGLAGSTLLTIICGSEAGKAPYTPPSGMTERLDESDDTNGGSVGLFDQGLAANGATGARVAVSTGTQANWGANLVLSGGSGDIEAPTISGSITVTGRTSSGYTLGGWAATDNLAVTGYERSLDGGATWADIGLVTSSTVTGRTPGSTDSVRIRAFDAAGNRSTALSASVTLMRGGVTGADIVAQTATGDNGPGALYDSMRPPATDARIYEFDVVSAPSSGTFTIYNNASFSLIGAADGAYSLVLRVWEDGVQLAPDLTHTITVGTPATLATGSASGAWSVRNLAAGTFSAASSVRNSASATQAGAWSVRAAVAGSASGAWSVRAYATGSVSAAWSVGGPVTAEWSGAWSVRSVVAGALSAAWSVLEDVPESHGQVGFGPFAPRRYAARDLRLAFACAPCIEQVLIEPPLARIPIEVSAPMVAAILRTAVAQACAPVTPPIRLPALVRSAPMPLLRSTNVNRAR